MELNAKNAFIRAKVVYKKEEYTVVKVNAKTVYITKKVNFLDLWKDKTSKITWKDFCKKHNAFMVGYDNIDISENEASKKESMTKVKKNKKRYLSKLDEKNLMILWNRFLKGKGSYKHVNETSKGVKYYIIECSKHGFILLRIGDKLVTYDFEKDEYFLFNKDVDKNAKEILWPSREGEVDLVA